MKPLVLNTMILLYSLCNPGYVHGQSIPADTFSIRVIARGLGNAVALRWAPVDLKTWKKGLNTGYRLERMTLTADGKALSWEEQESSRIVLSKKILPLPEPAWQAIADTNEIAIVAAAALYSRSFSIQQAQSEDMEDLNTIEENRFGFGVFAADQFMEIAIAMGLGWRDTAVQADAAYRYTVTLAENPDEAQVYPGTIKITPRGTAQLSPPGQFSGQYGDRKVRLKWDRSEANSPYTAYFVERSADAGRTAQKANRLPLIYTAPDGAEDRFMYFMDTLSRNGIPIWYRVRGKTPFGELGPPTAWIQGEGTPAAIPYQPFITGFLDNGAGGLVISWTVPEGAHGMITGFDVLKSASAEGPYIPVNQYPIDPEMREFTDYAPEHLVYYRVRLTDLNGHQVSGVSKLALLKDDIPPSPPEVKAGNFSPDIDSIHISWSPSPEADCYGYRIYSSNGENGDFLQITERAVTDTIYSFQFDHTQNRNKIFFRIKSVDYRGNYSRFSAPILVVIPDTRPPAPAVFKSVQSNAMGIRLSWANSSSSDLSRIKIEKKGEGEERWELLQAWSGPEFPTSFFDSTATPGSPAYFRITSIDEAGFSTTSAAVSGARTDNGIHGAISGFSLLRSQDNQALRLQWTCDNFPAVEYFIVYRATGSETLSTYRRVTPGSNELKISGLRIEFTDQDVRPKQRYRYQLIAKLKGGGYSRLSPEVRTND